MDSEGTRSLLELAVVGLISGAGGAFLTTLLRIRHERGELVRERMLVAADDFATGVVQAFIPLRLLGRIDRTSTDGQERFEQAVVHYGDLVDEVAARSARIELLFGPGSATANEALQVVDALIKARTELELQQPDLAKVTTQSHVAADHFTPFNQKANETITKPSPLSLLAWRQRRPKD